MIILLKRVNGKLMVIERHFYLFFFVTIAVGMLIAIVVIEADARSEDEPVCYSQACEKRMAENATKNGVSASEVERTVENLQLELNDSLKSTALLIEETEEEIVELVEKMSEYDLTMQQSDNDIRPTLNEFNSYKHVVKKAQDDYKKAFAEATSSEGLDEAKTLRDAYDEAVIELERLEQAYEDIKLKASEDEDTYWEKKRELMELRDTLEILQGEESDLKFDLRMSQRNSQFIVIDISGTCKVLHKLSYEDPDFTYPGNCLKVRDLLHLDTADPTMSGEFVDMGYDMVRQKSPYKEYWKYYEQIPNWKVITVAPADGEIYKKATVITVSPHTVHYLKPPGAKDPSSVQESFNMLSNERYEWYDIYVDRYCEQVMVSPDIAIVEKALQHVMRECKDPYETWIPKKTFKIWSDIPFGLPPWMNKIIGDIEEVVEEILPEPEVESVVCYSQACKRGMEDRGIPWRDP
tara:strand:- start:89 stop:1483 length:1395 start_codon:yes stop_codon:yes gene_type:complete